MSKRKVIQCPSVLGGCGGKGVAYEDEGLCPKCLKTANAK